MSTNLFWLLQDSNGGREAEWIDEEMDMESIKCPLVDGHQHSGKRLTDLSIALPGRSIKDFVWTWYSECLIQDHVLNILKQNHCTGFEVKPAKARFRGRTARQPPQLWELIVTGWAGMAPLESGIRLKQHCAACGHMSYTACQHPEKIISKDQWDGSDFFMVWPLPKYIFVTDRIADLIRQSRWTGIDLTPAKDLKLGDGGFSPGRLSYSMPAVRAKQLGEPLGIH